MFIKKKKLFLCICFSKTAWGGEVVTYCMICLSGKSSFVVFNCSPPWQGTFVRPLFDLSSTLYGDVFSNQPKFNFLEMAHTNFFSSI